MYRDGVESRASSLPSGDGLQAEQTERGKTFRNDRFLAVAERSILFKRYRDVRDLNPDVLEQIQQFFVSYNELAGKKFKPLKTVGAAAARKAVRVLGE